MTQVKLYMIEKVIRIPTARYMLPALQRVDMPQREAQLPPIQAHPLRFCRHCSPPPLRDPSSVWCWLGRHAVLLKRTPSSCSDRLACCS